MSTAVLNSTSLEFKNGTNERAKLTASDNTFTLSGISGSFVELKGLKHPTNGDSAASKAYVDSVGGEGLDVKEAVHLVSTVDVPGTWSAGTHGAGATITGSSNAALTIDGEAVTNGQRVLLQNQSDAYKNGIYKQTQIGTASTPFVLTRATDWDMACKWKGGSFVFVVDGSTVNVSSGWISTLTYDVAASGTVQLDKDSKVVTGTNTDFSNEFVAGQGLMVGRQTYHVVTVDSPTQITLNRTATESAAAGSTAYQGPVPGVDALPWERYTGAGQIVDGDGLLKNGNTLSVRVDDSTIEINSDILRVKAAGIDNTHIADDEVKGRHIDSNESIEVQGVTANANSEFKQNLKLSKASGEALTVDADAKVTGVLTCTAQSIHTNGLQTTGDITSSVDGAHALGSTSHRFGNLHVDNIGDATQTEIGLATPQVTFAAAGGIKTTSNNVLALNSGSGNTTVACGVLAVTGAQTVSSTLAVAGVSSVTNATDASATTTAAFKVTGGVGVGKKLFVGDLIDCQNSMKIGASGGGAVTIQPDSTATASYTLTLPPTLSTAGKVLKLADSVGTFEWGSSFGIENGNSSVKIDVTSDDVIHSVPSGKQHEFKVNSSEILAISGSGLNVTGSATISDSLVHALVTDATDSTTAAATFAGGVGIAKKLFVGSDLDVTGPVTLTKDTEATAANAAAVVLSGGLGVAKKLFTGDLIDCKNSVKINAGGGGAITVRPSPTSTASYTLTLPATLGTQHQVLKLDNNTGDFVWGSSFGIENGLSSVKIDVTSDDVIHSVPTGKQHEFKVNSTEVLAISGAGLNVTGSITSSDSFVHSLVTDASNSTTAAATFAGGVGIAKKLFVGATLGVGGIASFTDATDATAANAASVVLTGGLGVAKKINVGSDAAIAGVTTISNTTDSTAATDGALVVAGGIGVAKDAHFGADMKIVGDVTANQFTSVSWRTLKKNIRPATGSLAKLSKINAYTYNWNKQMCQQKGMPWVADDERHLGVMADEIEDHVGKEFVHTTSSGVKSVGYGKLTALLIGGMKEQQAIIKKQDRALRAMSMKLGMLY